MGLFRSSLEKELCDVISELESGNFIFCFEFNTPRFNVLNIETQKLKKCLIVKD